MTYTIEYILGNEPFTMERVAADDVLGILISIRENDGHTQDVIAERKS